MAELRLSYVDPKTLRPRIKALRKRHPRQIDYLKSSINALGFIEPVLTRDGAIVHGELRAIAAIALGLSTIPTIELAHLNDTQLRQCIIATNRIASLADFDEDALSIELGELANFDVDLSSLGFETAELDRLLGITTLEAESRFDDLPAVRSGPPVSAIGDVWLLGNRHKLLCGDALKASSYATLLGEERAQMILSDPPFNDPVKAISGNGKTQHPEFIQASGEMSENEYTRFLTTACRLMRDYSVDGALHFLFISWRHMLALLRAGNIVYDELKAIVTWVKPVGGMGALYRSRSEFIGVFKAGTARHVNNILLGKFGRNRTNCWEYVSLGCFQPGRDELLKMHPTIKPAALIADAILDASDIDAIILDPFAGSGTIFLAAEQTRRRARGMELDPYYADVCLRRFRDTYQIDPIHAATGRTFTDCERALADEPKEDIA